PGTVFPRGPGRWPWRSVPGPRAPGLRAKRRWSMASRSPSASTERAPGSGELSLQRRAVRAAIRGRLRALRPAASPGGLTPAEEYVVVRPEAGPDPVLVEPQALGDLGDPEDRAMVLHPEADDPSVAADHGHALDALEPLRRHVGERLHEAQREVDGHQ